MHEGEILALVGPNGAGKTTLVRIISGILRPTEGHVSVLGHDVQRDRWRRTDVAVVPQDCRPDPLLTPAEHVRYYLRARGWPRREADARALAMLAALGLDAERDVPAHQLSGGMQRRILLAMALATQAILLLLDEPTSGLDIVARRELWRLLAMTKTHAAVLLTTHDLHEAEVLADRVTILHEGVVLRTGTVPELRAMLRHQDKFVVEVPPDSPLVAELSALGECRALAGRTVLYVPDGRAAGTAARLASMHLSFSVQPTTLEDVYLDLLAQNDPDRASLVDP